MKVNFYIRPALKELKPIYCYFSFLGSREKIHTGLYCLKKQWQKRKQRIDPGYTGADRINSELDAMEKKLRSLFENQMPATPQKLKELYVTKPLSKGFFELYDDFIAESETRINNKKSERLSTATINQYRSGKVTLEEFEKKTNYKITFDQINGAFYAKFREFCLNDQKINPNSFGGKMKKLKTFLYWCQERDVPLSNKFWTFKVPSKYGEVDALTGKELLELWGRDFGKEQYKLDIFLALCCTGMRISDYNTVMTNMDKYIQQTKEGKAIIFNAQKTGETCIIPFFDDLYFRPVSLYKKYKGKMPELTGQKLNDFLRGTKITDRIVVTSKTGRKTLASIKYFELGTEAQFVMKQTGHKSESEFKRYIGVSADIVIKASKERSINQKAP